MRQAAPLRRRFLLCLVSFVAFLPGLLWFGNPGSKDALIVGLAGGYGFLLSNDLNLRAWPRFAGFAVNCVDKQVSIGSRLINHREIGNDDNRVGSQIVRDSFHQVDPGAPLAERNHAFVVFLLQRLQRLAPTGHQQIRIQQRHASIVGYIQRRADRFRLFAELLIEGLTRIAFELRPYKIFNA